MQRTKLVLYVDHDEGLSAEHVSDLVERIINVGETDGDCPEADKVSIETITVFTDPPRPKVIIQVTGGVADYVTEGDVDVELIDHDDANDGDPEAELWRCSNCWAEGDGNEFCSTKHAGVVMVCPSCGSHDVFLQDEEEQAAADAFDALANETTDTAAAAADDLQVKIETDAEGVSCLRCPVCGDAGRIIIVEDAAIWWETKEVEDGLIVAPSGYKVFDEGSTNQRLQCTNCVREFDVPENLEIDWR